MNIKDAKDAKTKVRLDVQLPLPIDEQEERRIKNLIKPIVRVLVYLYHRKDFQMKVLLDGERGTRKGDTVRLEKSIFEAYERDCSRNADAPKTLNFFLQCAIEKYENDLSENLDP